MAVTAATAAEVRKRDRNRCRFCGAHEHDPKLFQAGNMGRFVIHHVKPKGPGGTSDPARDNPANLALLHDECHRWVHDNPREGRALGLLRSRLGQVSPSALIARRPA
jgi:hypothetical protein